MRLSPELFSLVSIISGLVVFTLYLTLGLCCSFFFQAEDGIRDVERSRGLGDVYKRQPKSQLAFEEN